MFVENERVQRRHSALRTINGGICCGLIFLPPRLTQLRPLGYQWMVNSVGFKDILCFLNLASIIIDLFCEQGYNSCILLLSANSGGDFRQLFPRGCDRIAEPQ